MELKPGAVPAMSFSAGAATLAYYFLPFLTAAGIGDVVGIAALTAIIAPFAVPGAAALKRLTDRIAGQ